MTCKSSKFLLIAILTFMIGIAAAFNFVKFFSLSEPSLNLLQPETQILEIDGETRQTVETIQNAARRALANSSGASFWDCDNIDEWRGGGYAPKKYTVNGGVLNSKACMVEPINSHAAIDRKANGRVIVEVLVNGFGIVKSAKAIEGNPMLFKTSIDAAYKTKVCPTLLGGEFMNVKGVFVYNFVQPN
jgi:hypothetical protein